MTPQPEARADAAPAWFREAISAGLAAIVALSLEGHPPSDALRATASVWCYALWRRRAWHETRDAARIRDAFAGIAATHRRWPAPVDLLAHLPEAPQPLLPTPPASPSTVDWIARRQAIATAADPLAWAHRLRQREQSGERLSIVQRAAWRSALARRRAAADDPSTQEEERA